MRLTDQEIADAKALCHPAVNKLLVHYEFTTQHTAYASYVARKKTLDKWNGELIKRGIGLLAPEKTTDEDEIRNEKDVDRVLKYLKDQVDLENDTEALSAKLNGDQLEKAKKAISTDMAF